MFVLTPSFSGHSPDVYSETPHNATGHGKEEREMHHSVPVIEGIIPSLLTVSRSITGDSALAIKEYVRKGKGAAMYL